MDSTDSPHASNEIAQFETLPTPELMQSAVQSLEVLKIRCIEALGYILGIEIHKNIYANIEILDGKLHLRIGIGGLHIEKVEGLTRETPDTHRPIIPTVYGPEDAKKVAAYLKHTYLYLVLNAEAFKDATLIHIVLSPDALDKFLAEQPSKAAGITKATQDAVNGAAGDIWHRTV